MSSLLVWTPEMDVRLQVLWPTMTGHEIAEVMDITRPHLVWKRVAKLNLPRKKVAKRTEPPKAVWIRFATAEALRARVKPDAVLLGCRKRKVAIARWRAFRATLEACPTASVAGLARVAGYNHTSLLHGLDRLREIEAANPV